MTVRQRLAVRNFVIPGPLWWVFNWESARLQAEEAARRQTAQVEQWTPPQPDGGDPRKGCVLLVDEIDKAESDLPNGLLEALGAGQFTPFGIHDPVVASPITPLVVITTNEERALPDAFVRRCLVLPLSLPGPLSEPGKEAKLIDLLVGRGRAHFPDLDQAILDEAARQLVADRKKAIEQRWRPLPGQAEYLDLLRAVDALAPGDVQAQLDMMDRIGRYVLSKQVGSTV
jgi:MoxR-like ATPase